MSFEQPQARWAGRRIAERRHLFCPDPDDAGSGSREIVLDQDGGRCEDPQFASCHHRTGWCDRGPSSNGSAGAVEGKTLTGPRWRCQLLVHDHCRPGGES